MKLRLVHLSKEFVSLRGRIPAVKDVHLEVGDQEFFVLLGPSGCGKSTVLNLIAGLEEPSGGEIWFGDKVAASKEKRIFLSPKERNVAMVFQSYALYPHLNVFQNIAFPLNIAGERKESTQEKVRRAAAALGIEDLLQARPRELSGGQRQRVAIARALVRQPSVFLLDEPLSNLDAKLRASTRIELKRLQQQMGVTTVYVTHDQVEAMSLGNRVALLRDGRIEQIGEPAELYEKPANTFVAGFIGSPPMNLIKGFVDKEGEDVRVRAGTMCLKLDEARADVLTRSGLTECTLGIRPEDIRAGSTEEEKSCKWRIESVELLGREVLLRAALGGQTLTVLSADRRFVGALPGDAVHLHFDMEKMHLFETGAQQKSLI